MRFVFTGIVVAMVMLSVVPFSLYFKASIQEKRKLNKWRRSLVKGTKVLIDDGSVKFEGTVVNVTQHSIRIWSENNRSASYGLNCIYPLKPNQ